MAKRSMPPKYTDEFKQPDPADSSKPFSQQKVIVVNCHSLNVREKPSKDSKALFVAPFDTVFDVLERVESSWVHVVLPNSEKSGYVRAEYLKEI